MLDSKYNFSLAPHYEGFQQGTTGSLIFVFDFQQIVTLAKFTIFQTGNFDHNINEFTFQGYNGGVWNDFGNGILTGEDSSQSFEYVFCDHLDPGDIDKCPVAQLFRWNIINTFGNRTTMVSEVEFFGEIGGCIPPKKRIPCSLTNDCFDYSNPENMSVCESLCGMTQSEQDQCCSQFIKDNYWDSSLSRCIPHVVVTVIENIPANLYNVDCKGMGEPNVHNNQVASNIFDNSPIWSYAEYGGYTTEGYNPECYQPADILFDYAFNELVSVCKVGIHQFGDYTHDFENFKIYLWENFAWEEVGSFNGLDSGSRYEEFVIGELNSTSCCPIGDKVRVHVLATPQGWQPYISEVQFFGVKQVDLVPFNCSSGTKCIKDDYTHSDYFCGSFCGTSRSERNDCCKEYNGNDNMTWLDCSLRCEDVSQTDGCATLCGESDQDKDDCCWDINNSFWDECRQECVMSKTDCSKVSDGCNSQDKCNHCSSHFNSDYFWVSCQNDCVNGLQLDTTCDDCDVNLRDGCCADYHGGNTDFIWVECLRDCFNSSIFVSETCSTLCGTQEFNKTNCCDQFLKGSFWVDCHNECSFNVSEDTTCSSCDVDERNDCCSNYHDLEADWIWINCIGDCYDISTALVDTCGSLCGSTSEDRNYCCDEFTAGKKWDPCEQQCAFDKSGCSSDIDGCFTDSSCEECSSIWNYPSFSWINCLQKCSNNGSTCSTCLEDSRDTCCEEHNSGNVEWTWIECRDETLSNCYLNGNEKDICGSVHSDSNIVGTVVGVVVGVISFVVVVLIVFVFVILISLYFVRKKSFSYDKTDTEKTVELVDKMFN